MPKKNIRPEIKTDRSRSEHELQLRRAMAALRENHGGLIWTGVKHNQPSGPRVVLEVSFDLADQILHTLAEEAGTAWAPEDYATAAPTPKATAKPGLTTATTVKELRKIAKDHGIVGAAKMNKADLLEALA